MKMRLWGHVALFAGASLLSALVCPGAALADTFTPGAFVTYGAASWFSDSGAQSNLDNNFDTVYGPNDVLMVGSSAPGFAIFFTSPSGVSNYVPSAGPAGALTQTQANPSTSSGDTTSGVFGGDVTALALDVDFSAAGFLGTSSTPFGNLLLTGLTGSVAGLNGMSVSNLLALAEAELGGSSTLYDFTDLDLLVAYVGIAFEPDTPLSFFANDHLEFPNTDVSATPLPATFPLLATGLGALGLFAGRRKRKAGSIVA